MAYIYGIDPTNRHDIGLIYNRPTATMQIYVDCEVYMTCTNIVVNPSGFGLNNMFIGKSMYTADKTLNGRMKNFRYYNKAIR